MARPPHPNRFLRLLAYARPYKGWVLGQFTLMALAVGFGLLKPWPLKVILDNVVEDMPLRLFGVAVDMERLALLAAACLAYVLFHGGESLVQFGSTMVSSLTSSRMIRDLRADLLRALQALSLKFHDRHRVGDLVHRVTWNTQAVETAFQSGFMGVVKSLLMLVGIFVVMLAMNPLLTLVALFVVPLLVLAIRLYARHIARVSLHHQNQEGSVSSRLQELLSGIRLVQAFHREAMEQERFEELSGHSVRTRLRMMAVQGAFGASVALVLALGTALLFYVGIREVLEGRLTVGEFIVFNSYLAMLYSPLSVLSYTASSVQSALGGGQRLFEILEAEQEVADRPGAEDLPDNAASVAVEDLRFGYEPGQTVIEGLSFELGWGELVAVIGETGSGKSTILSLLMRFYRPSEGRIRIEQRDIADCTLSSLRRSLALVPQDCLLFSDSIRENIAYGLPGAGEEEIQAAARAAQAHDFISRLAEGYDTLVGERGIRLSAGQRQRVALARALLRPAPILLLDEPSSALDAETEQRLMRELLKRRGKQSILLVTHRLATVRQADRILLLSEGRLVDSGRHEEMLARGGAYARLWEAQSAEGALLPERNG